MESILLVDDDAVTLTLLSTCLERAGYPVMTATSGSAALAAVAEKQPALRRHGLHQ